MNREYKEHKEHELYPPVAEYFTERGYKVRGEVKGCDVAAMKDETLVIAELKLSFNMKVLMQAVARLSLTDYVYVAIPRPPLGARNGADSRYFRDMVAILKRLELGLMLVALDSPRKSCEVVLSPVAHRFGSNSKKRLAVIRELAARQNDANVGGVTRTKITTAYKETCVKVACLLDKRGALSTKQLRELGITDREIKAVTSRHQWFERVERGVYALSSTGKTVISSPTAEFAELVQYYNGGII